MAVSITGVIRKDRNTVESGRRTDYGNYQPDATNTGVLPGTVLTDWNAPGTTSVTWSTGGTLSNATIYGDVNFTNSTDMTFYNCAFVGGPQTPSTSSAVLGMMSNRTGQTSLYDCTIIPATPARNRDCCTGHNFNLYRCQLSQGVDCIGIFPYTGQTVANVEVAGCWMSNMIYWNPDYVNGVSGATWHTDGTHNDCCQIQGGTNIHMQGNYFDGTGTLGPGSSQPPTCTWTLSDASLANRYNQGQGIIIQNNTSAPPDNTVIIEQNWFNGSKIQTKIFPAMTCQFKNNHFYRNTAVGSGWSGYWVRMPDTTSVVTGLNVGTNNNTWVDGPYAGTVLTTPQQSGIMIG